MHINDWLGLHVKLPSVHVQHPLDELEDDEELPQITYDDWQSPLDGLQHSALTPLPVLVHNNPKPDGQDPTAPLQQVIVEPFTQLGQTPELLLDVVTPEDEEDEVLPEDDVLPQRT